MAVIFHDHKLETPEGAVDSTNDIYYLSEEPDSTSTIRVFINGLQQFNGVDFEFIRNEGRPAIRLFEVILHTGERVDDIKVEYLITVEL